MLALLESRQANFVFLHWQSIASYLKQCKYYKSVSFENQTKKFLVQFPLHLPSNQCISSMHRLNPHKECAKLPRHPGKLYRTPFSFCTQQGSFQDPIVGGLASPKPQSECLPRILGASKKFGKHQENRGCFACRYRLVTVLPACRKYPWMLR